jgi:hypothetical protein
LLLVRQPQASSAAVLSRNCFVIDEAWRREVNEAATEDEQQRASGDEQELKSFSNST